MIFLLIIGLTLLAASVFMIVRAAYGPRTGTTSATIQSIGAYGFSGSETVDKSSGKRPVSELATSIGNRLRGTRLSKGEVETRNMLVSAGMYSTSPDRFLGFQVISTVVIGLFTLWLLGISGMSVFWVIVLSIFAAVVGWMLPVGFVKRKVRMRHDQIEYELPDLIDLLVVSIEAGLSFPGAMRLAAERIRGPLGQELRLTLQEQNMGLTNEDALRNLYTRAETPGVAIFTRSIIQGLALGVSMAQIMRNIAEEMRKRRKAAAEEKAQKAPIKMLFPLVFLIFPSMFVVILLPAIITIAQGL
jgi:tight adherence protein C